MKFELPHTIENVLGEKLIFKSIIQEPDGDKVLAEAFVQPGAGPAMHVHYKQDESFTVIEGKMGYQFQGEKPQYAGPAESVVFKRGKPHRFWNAGQEVLHCEGWLKPANTIVFFLSALYDAQNKSGKGEPELFDGAYLLTRYRSEYGMPEMPGFVRNFIIPTAYFIGKLMGKYQKFEGAPAPVR
ncbi:MAG: cupin domain-containing protein [Lewinellaceae bacterium]|nr:cupin domain-containing protein [Phaeodactylibacter sp.]MCB9036612.1 cupin domain-containing protein [Lewinellaceae bacterium]